MNKANVKDVNNGKDVDNRLGMYNGIGRTTGGMLAVGSSGNPSNAGLNF